MTEYIPVTDEVTFFHRRKTGEYVVIREGLPFTVPVGDISMVLVTRDRSQRFLDKLVTGTVYEIEPRPDEPAAQAAYDRIVAEITQTHQMTAHARATGSNTIEHDMDDAP